jgi:phosphoribosylanthranilate isomerase
MARASSHRASDPHVIFPSNNSRKTKTATAPLAATIVQYHGPQQMSNMSMIAEFQSHLKPSFDGFG